MTQNELADGICTQNTISKIEKHNIAPTTNILMSICIRLGLTLNDVFSEFESNFNDENALLYTEIEQDFMLEKNKEATSKMNVSSNGDPSNELLGQYHFCLGFKSFIEQKYQDSLFYMDQVLQQTKNETYDIYTLLAYTIKSMCYEKMDDKEKSSYFLTQVKDSVAESFDIPNANLLQKLFLCYRICLSSISDNETKEYYADRGIEINKQNYSVFYMSTFYQIKSVNDKKFGEYSKLFKKIYS